MKDKLRELAERWKEQSEWNASGRTKIQCADELLSILDADGDGGAVAWQYRYKNDRMQWSRWLHWEIEGREDQFPEKIGRWEVEYRQLYTHPARSGVVSDEDVRDAARLDFLDARNLPMKMGWHIGKAPMGNVNVQSVIQLGDVVTSIRQAIDAAIQGERHER